MSDEVKMVPAVCTQCGGKLTVDPTKETAECPFCGASFVVEKAINNYNVQNATIDHVDNVNIDMSGTVHTVLDFVGKQMSESREMKPERSPMMLSGEGCILIFPRRTDIPGRWMNSKAGRSG